MTRRQNSCFTNDTVLTAAVEEWLMDETNLVDMLHRYVAWYPNAGYGETFIRWAQCGERDPCDSWGNGSAMRVSPCAWFASSLAEAIKLATASSIVTHNHPDGVRGAVATAGAIYLARTGETKNSIRDFVSDECGYDVLRPLHEIRERYIFDVSCSGSVPEAITAFLESDGYESAIRNAVSLGGDADTGGNSWGNCRSLLRAYP
jgi:ADP-ribosylglycohydrolase